MATKATEELQKELERLKRQYKKEKARLEWVDNTLDEALIEARLSPLKERIRALVRRIASENGKNGGEYDS